MQTSRGSGQGDGGKGMGMDKLKVLQLGKQYYPHIGGVEATMQQIAEGIQGEVDSYVLASQGRGAAYEKTINGVPVYFAKSLGIIASLPISWALPPRRSCLLFVRV